MHLVCRRGFLHRRCPVYIPGFCSHCLLLHRFHHFRFRLCIEVTLGLGGAGLGFTTGEGFIFLEALVTFFIVYLWRLLFSFRSLQPEQLLYHHLSSACIFWEGSSRLCWHIVAMPALVSGARSPFTRAAHRPFLHVRYQGLHQ